MSEGLLKASFPEPGRDLARQGVQSVSGVPAESAWAGFLRGPVIIRAFGLGHAELPGDLRWLDVSLEGRARGVQL